MSCSRLLFDAVDGKDDVLAAVSVLRVADMDESSVVWDRRKRTLWRARLGRSTEETILSDIDTSQGVHLSQ